MKKWTWWIYRVLFSGALSGLVWDKLGFWYAALTFVIVLVVDVSAYYDGISVGEAKNPRF